MITQEQVRTKLIEKLVQGQQKYIAKQINIPYQVLSNFKTGKRDLYPESLQALNEYLNKH